MKKLKPFLRIIAFAAVLVLVLHVLTYLARPDFPDVKDIAGFYGEPENALDLVYIGGSAAFVYYAPLTAWEEFGLASYVYGANTIQAELYVTLIREMLKTQHPKLILLDARAFQYRDPENEDAQPPAEVPYRNTLNGMPLSWNKIQFIRKYVGTETVPGPRLPYYLDLIKFHQNIPDYSPDNLAMLTGSYYHPHSGFHFVEKWAPIERYAVSATEQKAPSAETQQILTELLDYLDETGIACMFIVSPYAEKDSHKMTYNYVAEQVTARGYAFLDCNEKIDEIGLDFSEDFYNENHVTVFGAEKYTRFLTPYLMERYDLPDRRRNADYAFLDDRLPGWHEAMEQTKAAICKLMEEGPTDAE